VVRAKKSIEPIQRSFPQRSPKSTHMLLGRDCRGRWVALDHQQNCGGLFVSRDAAYAYARAETGGRDAFIELTDGTLEFRLEPGCTLGASQKHRSTQLR
jgi:hypothetical protein